MPACHQVMFVLSSYENSCIRSGFRDANIQQISVTFCRASFCLTYFTYKKQGALPHAKTPLYKSLTDSWFRKWPGYESKVAEFCFKSGRFTVRKWPSYESLTVETGFQEGNRLTKEQFGALKSRKDGLVFCRICELNYLCLRYPK